MLDRSSTVVYRCPCFADPDLSCPHPDDTISLDELLAAAAERGYPASPRQAKRLRAEDMLRCLGQDHPAGRRGSRSNYQALEVDRLALVMRVGTSERRFDERRVLLDGAR